MDTFLQKAPMKLLKESLNKETLGQLLKVRLEEFLEKSMEQSLQLSSDEL